MTEQERKELEEDEREAWRLTKLELESKRTDPSSPFEKAFRTSFSKASPTATALASKEKLSPIISRSGSLAASDRESSSEISPQGTQTGLVSAAHSVGIEPRSNPRYQSPLRLGVTTLLGRSHEEETDM
jgi:hypothetical protein